MNRRKRDRLFILTAVVAFFAIVEIFFRVTGFYRASEEKFYENIFDPLARMIPGARNPYATMADFMNDYGLRGMTFERRKPSDIFRIVCLGDSTTFGLGDYGNSYPKVLEKFLKKFPSKKTIEVINAGIPGTGIYQQKMHFKEIFRGTDPDIVLLMTGPNFRADLKAYRDKMKSPPFRVVNFLQDVFSRTATYRAMRLAIKSRSKTRVLDDSEIAAPEDRYSQESYREDYLEDLSDMKSLARWWGFRLVFLSSVEQEYIKKLHDMGLDPDASDYLQRAFQLHNDHDIVEFAYENGIPLIDLSNDFLRVPPETPNLWHDPGHPGDLGNAMIAERVATELKKLDFLPD